MRLLQVTVPNSQREAVVEVLREKQFGYTIVDYHHSDPERA